MPRKRSMAENRAIHARAPRGPQKTRTGPLRAPSGGSREDINTVMERWEEGGYGSDKLADILTDLEDRHGQVSFDALRKDLILSGRPMDEVDDIMAVAQARLPARSILQARAESGRLRVQDLDQFQHLIVGTKARASDLATTYDSRDYNFYTVHDDGRVTDGLSLVDTSHYFAVKRIQ